MSRTVQLLIDSFTVGSGNYTDGRSRSTTERSHWFDDHPAFKKKRLLRGRLLRGCSTLLRYQGSFTFDVPRHEIWRALCSVESYEEWAPWMRDLQVQGDGLAPGTIFQFEVASRLPLRMDLEIEIIAVEEGQVVVADVRGDLVGDGRLYLRDAGPGTEVELAWEVDVASKPLRTLLFVSAPLVRWTQEWAVQAAVAGARRRFAEG